MTDRDLSVQVAAREADTSPSSVTEADHRAVRVDLHHRCLPKLEAAGWIERRPAGITTAESLTVRDEDALPSCLQDPDHPHREAIGVLLARPRRRDIVSIVAGRRHRLTLAELAAELTERDRTSWTTEQGEDESAVLGTLHHVDLPRLAEVGLVEYDPDERTITRTHALMTLADQTAPDNG